MTENLHEGIEQIAFVSARGINVKLSIGRVESDGGSQVQVQAEVGDRRSDFTHPQEPVALAGALGSVPLLKEAKLFIAQARTGSDS